jgi:hypothetical protein
MRKRKDDIAHELRARVVAEIESCGTIAVPMTDPKILELRELERQHREEIRAAERAEAERERRLAEQQKVEQERRAAQVRAAEQAKQRTMEQQQRRQAASERQQLAALHQEWAQFKAATVRAQHEQAQEHYFNELQQRLDALNRLVNPPPAPVEPEIVYVEKEENPAWGQLPTLPSWR